MSCREDSDQLMPSPEWANQDPEIWRIVQLLAGTALFSSLSTDNLRRVAGGCKTMHFRRDNVLFLKGDPRHGFYLTIQVVQDWAVLARPRQTVVIYMRLGAIETICRELVAHGLPAQTPAVVIESGSTSEQRTVGATVAELPACVRTAGVKPPALIVIGPVAALHRPERERAIRALITRGEVFSGV